MVNKLPTFNFLSHDNDDEFNLFELNNPNNNFYKNIQSPKPNQTTQANNRSNKYQSRHNPNQADQKCFIIYIFKQYNNNNILIQVN
jgi:hypothetical protein